MSRNPSIEFGTTVCKSRYEIRELIGRGSSGEVFLALDLQSNPPITVAIKRLDLTSKAQGQSSGFEQLHRECLALSKMVHPSIVNIFDVDISDEQIFIVEELLIGGNLATEINRCRQLRSQQSGAMNPREVAHIGLMMAHGLSEIHSRGFFHGDIKPTNIGYRDEARTQAVLLDFGQSNFLDALILQQDGEQKASLPYLPPEISGLIGEIECVPRDLYSLGVTLYECAVGEVPFAEQDPKLVIRRVLTEVPPPVSEIVQDFPEALSDIICKLMRKQPSDRYQTASGLMVDLEFCCEALDKGETPRIFALGRGDKIRELNYRIPMIGRKEESNRLRQVLRESREKKGEILFISAPSGIGKSRLSMEFAAEARMQGIGASFTKFSEFERNLPFSAIHTLVHDLSRRLAKTPVKQIEHWKERVLERLQSEGNLLLERFPDLSYFFPEFPPLRAMKYEESSQAFLRALGTFLTLLDCDGKGQVVILDDVQWADTSSIDMLHEILRISSEQGLDKTVIIATFRSNEVIGDHPLISRVLCDTKREQRIELGPLSKDESKMLIEAIIDEHGPEVDKLFEFAFRMTMGNPFFSYESVKSLIASKVFYLDEQEGKWLFDEKKQTSINISAGMADLVSERIKRIPQLEQDALIIASIVGSSFSLSIMTHLIERHILNQIDDNTGSALDQYRNESPEKLTLFVQKQLIANQLIIPSETRWIFFHDKVREAAIDLASVVLKTAVHQSCGEYMATECLALDGGEEAPSQLIYDAAFHLMRGSPTSSREMAKKIFFIAAKRAVEVFAYRKALDYLEAASSLFETNPQTGISDEEKDEWIAIHELMGDALGLSLRIKEAVSLLDLVYEVIDDPLHKAEVCAKRVDYNLSLFRYSASITAGKEGLSQVGMTPCDSEISALFNIIFWTPWIIALNLWVRLFGKRKSKSISREDSIRLKLLLAYEVPSYFSSPLIAITIQYRLIRELTLQEDSYYRALMMTYLGVVTANIGLTTISERCFDYSMSYFEKNPNPVAQGFTLFVAGYLLYFPTGRATEARKKVEKAYEILLGVGESFWQSLCLQALVHIDYFCSDSNQTIVQIRKLIALWEQIQFEPCVFGCSLRCFLYEGKDDELKKWINITREGGNSVESQGFESIDLIYTYLLPGEIHLIRGEYDKALPLIKRAFNMVMKHTQRVAICNQSPVLLAQAYIRSNQPFKSLVPLAVAYLNPLLSVSVFHPYTLYATGEFLQKIGLFSFGHFVMQRGVRYARVRGWMLVAAEGWLRIGECLMRKNPDRAEDYLKKAIEYFASRGHKFLASKAQEMLHIAHKELLEIEPLYASDKTDIKTTGLLLRQEIETSALLDIFLELSSLTQIETILDAILEALCRCTGAEIGVIFTQHETQWLPTRSIGVDHESLSRGHYGLAGIDKGFFDSCVSLGSIGAHVRPPSTYANDMKGSTLVLPLAYKGKISGMCYLSNRQFSNLFDEQSIETINPIAAQAAIALQNMELLAETEKKARLIAEHTETLKRLVVAGQNIASQTDFSTISDVLVRSLQELVDSALSVEIFVHGRCIPDADVEDDSADRYYFLRADGFCDFDLYHSFDEFNQSAAIFPVKDPRGEYVLAFVRFTSSNISIVEEMTSVVEAICTNVASALTTVRLEQVLYLFEERTRDIRTIFENINQGICMIDANLHIGRHLSREMQIMFGESVTGGSLDQILQSTILNAEEQSMILSTIDCSIGSDSSAFFVNEQLLPKETRIVTEKSEQILELDWTPILDNSQTIQRIMLTIRNVTEFHKLRQAASLAATEVGQIREVLACDPVVLDNFFRDMHTMGERVRSLISSNFVIDETKKASLKRDIHTLKGTGRLLKFASITESIHNLETNLLHSLSSADSAVVDSILGNLDESSDICQQYKKIEDSLRNRSTVQQKISERDPVAECLAVLEKMEIETYGLPLESSARRARGLLLELEYSSLHQLVKQVFHSARDIAVQELKKPEPTLECQMSSNWLMKHASAKIISESLNHIFRNIVDHGFAENEKGVIFVKCQQEGNSINMSINSTEKGLNLGAIEKKFITSSNSEMPSSISDEELAEQIFRAGVTTAESVSQISGRGIGMDAVRSMLSEIGSTICVEFLGPRDENGRRPFRYLIMIPSENVEFSDIVVAAASAQFKQEITIRRSA